MSSWLLLLLLLLLSVQEHRPFKNPETTSTDGRRPYGVFHCTGMVHFTTKAWFKEWNCTKVQVNYGPRRQLLCPRLDSMNVICILTCCCYFTIVFFQTWIVLYFLFHMSIRGACLLTAQFTKFLTPIPLLSVIQWYITCWFDRCSSTFLLNWFTVEARTACAGRLLHKLSLSVTNVF